MRKYIERFNKKDNGNGNTNYLLTRRTFKHQSQNLRKHMSNILQNLKLKSKTPNYQEKHSSLSKFKSKIGDTSSINGRETDHILNKGDNDFEDLNIRDKIKQNEELSDMQHLTFNNERINQCISRTNLRHSQSERRLHTRGIELQSKQIINITLPVINQEISNEKNPPSRKSSTQEFNQNSSHILIFNTNKQEERTKHELGEDLNLNLKTNIEMSDIYSASTLKNGGQKMESEPKLTNNNVPAERKLLLNELDIYKISDEQLENYSLDGYQSSKIQNERPIKIKKKHLKKKQRKPWNENKLKIIYQKYNLHKHPLSILRTKTTSPDRPKFYTKITQKPTDTVPNRSPITSDHLNNSLNLSTEINTNLIKYPNHGISGRFLEAVEELAREEKKNRYWRERQMGNLFLQSKLEDRRKSFKQLIGANYSSRNRAPYIIQSMNATPRAKIRISKMLYS